MCPGILGGWVWSPHPVPSAVSVMVVVPVIVCIAILSDCGPSLFPPDPPTFPSVLFEDSLPEEEQIREIPFSQINSSTT